MRTRDRYKRDEARKQRKLQLGEVWGPFCYWRRNRFLRYVETSRGRAGDAQRQFKASQREKESANV